MEHNDRPLKIKQRRIYASIVGTITVLLIFLLPFRILGELPDSPEILVKQLQEALSSRDLSAYTELLADDFVFTPPAGLDTLPLNRQQELDLMERFLAGVAQFEVEVEILTQTRTNEESLLEVRWRVLALDENFNGYRLDIIRNLILVESPSGWQLLEWIDTRTAGVSEEIISSWYELRLAYAVQTTAIRVSSWGHLKQLHY